MGVAIRRRASLRMLIGLLALMLVPFTAGAIGQRKAGAAINGCLAGEIVGVAATPSGAGYWLVGSDGGVFSYGDAQFKGSAAKLRLNKPVVDIVPTASGGGYWLVAADGGVFTYGDAQAPANNPLPGMQLNQPVVAAVRQGTSGLVLTAGDGGVFALGGARFYGGANNLRLNKPVVDIVSTATGAGYWLVAADGGVFTYGDAQPLSSNPLPSMQLNQPVVAGIRQGTTGLVLTAGDGGVFALGGAQFYGSANNLTLAKPVSGIAPTADDRGYWLAARDGGLFSYGNAGFYGNAVPATTCTPPTSTTGAKIVQIATDIMNQKTVPGWGGGYALPYAWGGGHGSKPGPSYGTCGSGYRGPQPCKASSTFGVDCSGLTRWVYAIAYGSDVLGAVNTNGQIARLRRVSTPQPGDLVFFGTTSANTHHVGIYVGNGKMINAARTDTVIRQDTLHRDLVGYYRY
jgi:hypothetical protein